MKSGVTDIEEEQQFKEAPFGSHSHPLMNYWKDS